MIVNLTAALAFRLDLNWRTAGLWIAHAGIILLVVGEFAAGAFQVESRMSLPEGKAVAYAESPEDLELVLAETPDPSSTREHALPASRLRRSGVLAIPGTPFTVKVGQYLDHAALAMRGPASPLPGAEGLARQVEAMALPADVPGSTAVQLELLAAGRSLGTWLLSDRFGEAQAFAFEGRTGTLDLRPRRERLPCILTLRKFTHEVYPGTDIPKNFSSLVHISNPAKGEERDVLIRMNQPLRYEGMTFYQASYGEGDRLSILQVVRNPARRLPYLACSLVALGLLAHFAGGLCRASRHRRGR